MFLEWSTLLLRRVHSTRRHAQASLVCALLTSHAMGSGEASTEAELTDMSYNIIFTTSTKYYGLHI